MDKIEAYTSDTTNMSSVEFENGIYKVKEFFFNEEEFEYDDEDYEPIEDGEYIWKSDKFYLGDFKTLDGTSETIYALSRAIAKAIIDRSINGINEPVDVEMILDLWMEHLHVDSDDDDDDDDDDEDEVAEIINHINNYFYSRA